MTKHDGFDDVAQLLNAFLNASEVRRSTGDVAKACSAFDVVSQQVQADQSGASSGDSRGQKKPNANTRLVQGGRTGIQLLLPSEGLNMGPGRASESSTLAGDALLCTLAADTSRYRRSLDAVRAGRTVGTDVLESQETQTLNTIRVQLENLSRQNGGKLPHSLRSVYDRVISATASDSEE